MIRTLYLDPTHPTLDHHRPGRDPLFGTAMGIAAMLDAAAHDGDVPTGIRAVTVAAPYILATPGPHRLSVEVDARSGADDAAARLMSPGTTHFTGVVEWRGQASPPPAEVAAPGAAVDAETIYATFFHGPAFQVVAAARLAGSGLAASGLVATASTAPAIAALPPVVRLIEFGLQSAGLLELALTGRMRVPHAVAHIALLAPLPHASAPLVATARQRHEGDAVVSDIVVGGDRSIVAIAGYATVDLPFPADGAGLAGLRRALLATMPNASRD